MRNFSTNRSNLFRLAATSGSFSPCRAQSRARSRGNGMACLARLTLGRIVLGVFGLLVCLLVIAGLAGGGLPAGLAVLGLALLLIGSGAALVGRARWAFIAGRKASGAVAAAGLGHARGGRRHRSADCTGGDQACSARTPVDRWGSKKIRCSAAPVNGWHRSPVCTSDPGHTWSGRHWRSSSCDWPSGPEQSRLQASPPSVCAPRALAHRADGGRSSGSDRNSSRSKPDQRDRQWLGNSGP